MNLSLVDPFVLAQDCPDVITGRLREFDILTIDAMQSLITRR
jgi:COMPASS component SWD1